MKRFHVRRVSTVTQDFYVWADSVRDAHRVADGADLTAGDARIDDHTIVAMIEVPVMLTGADQAQR